MRRLTRAPPQASSATPQSENQRESWHPEMARQYSDRNGRGGEKSVGLRELTFCAVTVLVVLIMLAERLGASEVASEFSSPSKRYGALWSPSFKQRCFQNSESWTLYMLYCRDILANTTAPTSENPEPGRSSREGALNGFLQLPRLL